MRGYVCKGNLANCGDFAQACDNLGGKTQNNIDEKRDAYVICSCKKPEFYASCTEYFGQRMEYSVLNSEDLRDSM